MIYGSTLSRLLVLYAQSVVLPLLPSGEKWRSWWDDVAFEGNQTVTVPAPLDRFPLFYRGAKPL